MVWGRTKTGAACPFDPIPSNENLKGYRLENGIATYVKDNDGSDRAPEPLHTSHFATCPNAAKHRK